jgi:hypothetical protein
VTFDPNSAVDYMSYCAGPRWTSPYGYLAIMAALKSGSFSSGQTGALTGAAISRATKEDYAYVAFQIQRAGSGARVTLRTTFHIPRTPPRPLNDLDTDVTIELVDASDNLLFHAPCSSDNHRDESLPFRNYTVLFPNYPELRTVRIVQPGL